MLNVHNTDGGIHGLVNLTKTVSYIVKLVYKTTVPAQTSQKLNTSNIQYYYLILFTKRVTYILKIVYKVTLPA